MVISLLVGMPVREWRDGQQQTDGCSRESAGAGASFLLISRRFGLLIRGYVCVGAEPLSVRGIGREEYLL